MIVVVDYGMGNLRSVSKALEHLGAQVQVSASLKDIEKADRVVLPGVGAFGDAVRELNDRKLFEPLRKAVQDGKPFLGICLGLQLLFSSSEENPGAKGLGIFPGKVQAFRSRDVKIPHMGWNQVVFEHEHPLFQGVPNKSFFYFVHSYYGVPDDSGLTAGSCLYGEENFAAILADKNVFAAQFHPEKSQEAGLELLKNFLDWSP